MKVAKNTYFLVYIYATDIYCTRAQLALKFCLVYKYPYKRLFCLNLCQLVLPKISDMNRPTFHQVIKIDHSPWATFLALGFIGYNFETF